MAKAKVALPMIGAEALVVRVNRHCNNLTMKEKFWAAESHDLLRMCASALSLAVTRDVKLKKISEQSCGCCDYDEAEGGLINHCDACCRKIATEVWSLVHTEREL